MNVNPQCLEIADTGSGLLKGPGTTDDQIMDLGLPGLQRDLRRVQTGRDQGLCILPLGETQAIGDQIDPESSPPVKLREGTCP